MYTYTHVHRGGRYTHTCICRQYESPQQHTQSMQRALLERGAANAAYYPNCTSTKSWRVCMTVPAFVMPSYPPQVPQARRRTFQTRPGHGALPPGPLSPCPPAALAPLRSTQRACLGEHARNNKGRGWRGGGGRSMNQKPHERRSTLSPPPQRCLVLCGNVISV